MNQTNKNKNILIFVVIAVLAFGVGYYSGASLEKFKSKDSQETALKEIFGGILSGNNLSGTIAEISGDKKSLTVSVERILGVNLPKDYQKKRVLVNGNTKITLRENKSQEEWNKEFQEFQKKTATPGATPPYPYTEKEITINDLKAGDSVNFTFSPDQNKTALDSQFSATQITVGR